MQGQKTFHFSAMAKSKEGRNPLDVRRGQSLPCPFILSNSFQEAKGQSTAKKVRHVRSHPFLTEATQQARWNKHDEGLGPKAQEMFWLWLESAPAFPGCVAVLQLARVAIQAVKALEIKQLAGPCLPEGGWRDKQNANPSQLALEKTNLSQCACRVGGGGGGGSSSCHSRTAMRRCSSRKALPWRPLSPDLFLIILLMFFSCL